MESISEKIDKAMADLGSELTWGEVPKRIGGNVLEELSVVVVDSELSALEVLLPFLVTYFKSARAILYQGQDIEDIADQVWTIKPDILLVGHQSEFDGRRLVKEVKKKGYTSCVIGFSSERDARHKLMKSGAIGCVGKEPREHIAERVIAAIARIFETRKQLNNE